MFKKFLYLMLATSLFAACSNDKNKPLNQQKPTFELSQFEEMAGQYVGQEVIITGTCDHVCKHGGGRMFLINTDGDSRVEVLAGDAGAFQQEMEGSDIVVKGLVEEMRIDNAYLDKWEQEVMEGTEEEESVMKLHTGEPGHELNEGKETELQKIIDLRTSIIDSGKPYLSFYSIKALSYEAIKE
ncbi:MAG: hypothetical protein Q7J34_13520 [Bacteroidales bacterium]|nr:hypothetical protein [Bacteroidales bacterium]